jgi:hypothetical protein
MMCIIQSTLCPQQLISADHSVQIALNCNLQAFTGVEISELLWLAACIVKGLRAFVLKTKSLSLQTLSKMVIPKASYLPKIKI